MLDGLNAVLWGWAAVAVLRSGAVVRGTTLTTVVPWVWPAVVVWSAVALSGCFPNLHTAAWRSHLVYIAAVWSLVPVIAVLGARRPTCRAWPLFVLLPMVVVLLWPLLPIFMATGWSRPLELETPHRVIFGFVVLMGFGNYLGTRLTLPMLLAAAALLTVVLNLKPTVGESAVDRELLWTVGNLGVAIAVVWGTAMVRGPFPGGTAHDRVWSEFTALYGLVWSRRLLDRLQYLSRKQNWNCEVTPHGFCANTEIDQSGANTEIDPPTTAAIDHALRWLLRRFVDSDWLDARLGPTESRTDASLTIDL